MAAKRKGKQEDSESSFDSSGMPIDEGKKKALEAALGELTKRFGDGTIIALGEASHMIVETIPTGSLTLDLATGVGGVPRGRVVEIYGPESSGKTTLCLHIIGEAQRRGGLAAFVDMEHALDPTYAGRLGVDLNRLYVSQPDTGEQALEITETLVRSSAFDVIVIDSVAALVPRAEIEGEMGDSHVGIQARLMSQAMRKLAGAIKASNCVVLFTNQIREKVGISYGCFSHHTGVMLADGTMMDIGRIVNQKLPVEVMSYNEQTGCFEPKRVVNWFKGGLPVDEYTLSDNDIGKLRDEYVTLVARYPDGKGFTKVTSTPNHEIATPYGWVSAEDIELGDQIMTMVEETAFSRDLHQLILGSLLGDGSLRQSGHMTAYFREEHGHAQTEYVTWKHGAFGSLATALASNDHGVGFSSVALPAFARLKAMMYREGGRYKTIDERALRQLTAFSLAVWYQDDGTRSDENGARRRNTIYFHRTDAETREMVTRVLYELFGLKATLHTTKTTTHINFNGDEGDRFEALIAPYVHPSMAYKLRTTEPVGAALGSLIFTTTHETVAMPCDVFEVRRSIREGMEAVRYNLQVEGNANYIVGKTLVHNSPETTPGGAP